MKKFWVVFFLLFSVCALAQTVVFFSPSNKCENGLVELIDNSTSTIDAAVYAINNDNIVEALKKAHDRGVKIRILTDRLQAAGKSSKVRELRAHGINVRVHSKFKIEHNKFAIFDGKKVSTGSYNWTNAASNKNSENCVFFTEISDVVTYYRKRFRYLWQVNTRKASEEWFNKKKLVVVPETPTQPENALTTNTQTP